MPITQFTKPMFNDQTLTEAQFNAAINRFGSEIDQFAAELEAGLSAMNLNDLNSTSVNSIAMSLVQKSITVQANKSYLPGIRITVARTSDPTKNMDSLVISYNESTGALVFLPLVLNGAGTYSDWTITFAGVVPTMADNEIVLHTGNGIGSVNTAIQRYFVVQKDTSGSFMTYTSSASLGDSITIDRAGDYEVFRHGAMTTSSAHMGASLNSGALSTSFVTRMNSNPEEFILGFDTHTQTSPRSSSRTMRLAAGDVIRAHNHNSSADSGNGFTSFFTIKRLGFI